MPPPSPLRLPLAPLQVPQWRVRGRCVRPNHSFCGPSGPRHDHREVSEGRAEGIQRGRRHFSLFPSSQGRWEELGPGNVLFDAALPSSPLVPSHLSLPSPQVCRDEPVPSGDTRPDAALTPPLTPCPDPPPDRGEPTLYPKSCTPPSLRYAGTSLALVTHGLTLRIFLMRWFHWTVDEFLEVFNPRNCEVGAEREGWRGRAWPYSVARSLQPTLLRCWCGEGTACFLMRSSSRATVRRLGATCLG